VIAQHVARLHHLGLTSLNHRKHAFAKAIRRVGAILRLIRSGDEIARIREGRHQNAAQLNSVTLRAATDPTSPTSVEPCKMSAADTSCLTLHLSRKTKVLRPPVETTGQSWPGTRASMIARISGPPFGKSASGAMNGPLISRMRQISISPILHSIKAPLVENAHFTEKSVSRSGVWHKPKRQCRSLPGQGRNQP